MRPDEGDLTEELRGHLAIEIKERIDRGEDPESARLAALREFGYVPAVRDEMRRVWYSRGYDQAEALARDIRFAWRSLSRAKALTATVVVTLGLGIGGQKRQIWRRCRAGCAGWRWTDLVDSGIRSPIGVGSSGRAFARVNVTTRSLP